MCHMRQEGRFEGLWRVPHSALLQSILPTAIISLSQSSLQSSHSLVMTMMGCCLYNVWHSAACNVMVRNNVTHRAIAVQMDRLTDRLSHDIGLHTLQVQRMLACKALWKLQRPRLNVPTSNSVLVEALTSRQSRSRFCFACNSGWTLFWLRVILADMYR